MLDPTRTLSLRRKFAQTIGAAYGLLRIQIKKAVIDEDGFGLKSPNITTNTRFVFETTSGKVSAFKDWLQEQIEEGILRIDSDGFVESSYKKAVERSYIDVKKLAKDSLAPDVFAEGQKAQFLQSTFSASITQEQLELIFTRTYDNLKGVTDEMGRKMSQTLARGLADGLSPRNIARDLTDILDGDKKRALRVARTEMINAYAEGQLDTYEQLGIDKVGVLAEWITANDPCPRCASAATKVYTIKAARGLIPLHPNCRCAWAPYVERPGVKGKKRAKRRPAVSTLAV